MREKSHVQNKLVHEQLVFNLKQGANIPFYSVKKNYRKHCTKYGIPHSPDYPSSCFFRMVSQLKLLLQTPVPSVELFSQLLGQENTQDVLTASLEAHFKFATIFKREQICARVL